LLHAALAASPALSSTQSRLTGRPYSASGGYGVKLDGGAVDHGLRAAGIAHRVNSPASSFESICSLLERKMVGSEQVTTARGEICGRGGLYLSSQLECQRDDRMRRRILLAGLSGTALAGAPSRAQQPATTPLIGYLGGRSLATDAHLLQSVKDGLKDSGYVEGQNVAFEFRWADGRFDRLEVFAAELVARKPDLIIAVGGTPVPLAAKAVTSTIPIVFSIGFDPVALKLVGSLSRPGGNATGAMLLASALEGKRIDLLKAMRPDIRWAALLVNPTSPMLNDLESDGQRVAGALGVRLEIIKAANVAELDRALAELAARKPDGLAVSIDGFLVSERHRIIDWAAHERVPAIFPAREFTEEGGLASYAPRWSEMYRWIGIYAGRVLKGAKPGDLPIQQPTAYELVVNLKTARALGVTLPAAFTSRADEVIE
jgi:putative tryptophan/tyrosine transport system substrate-binding protein